MSERSTTTSVVLASIPKGPKTVNRVSLDEHGARRFVNVRQWYQSPDGTWRPTRRGVTFELADLQEVQQAIREAIQRTTRGKA